MPSTIVSDHVCAKYDSPCGPTDQFVVSDDRRRVVHDRPLVRSSKPFSWSDARFDATDRPFTWDDAQNTGAGRSLDAYASA
ncbi:MAG TPA: hypothetical protein VGQ56_16105 [Gemmatimonadaceae bacterium]|nr:hypothetical protein [Gemmatimonadaceae bacterium]